MAITNAFREAVASKNIRRLRIMMKDSLLVDPSFHEFKEMERLSASVDGLYDKHDGKSFVLDDTLWDDNYMDKLMVQVVGNFSHERIRHLMDVVNKLRPVKNIQTKKSSSRYNESKLSYEEIKKQDQASGRYIGSEPIIGAGIGAGVGLVGGGFVAATVGGSVACGLAIGAVAGAAIGGVIGAAIEGGGNKNE